ncbi:probable protein phosphatase 2C 14 [Lycium ferocissimum]|uniref:probable protein phosphatase 2C 14 n=1 Tax=Lycium ferocissimum TaxID=112874 RepID=UPI0028169884|nr:probable protein phosphatase 2C 14 [Lycium ferocissimum]
MAMQISISTSSTLMKENNNIPTNQNNMNADSFCSLKRKRPPNIEIPTTTILSEIPLNSLNAAADTNTTTPICFVGNGVAFFSRKGKKTFMEDTHNIISTSHPKRGFFGVYDGHGGRKAAEFVAENLHSYVFEMLDNGSSMTKEKAIEAAYIKIDQHFLKQGVGSGACCVTALIEGKEIIVSNVGDCRAVLCRSGVAEAVTRDHRAEREDERKRIEDKGGYVEFHKGGWRVHGVLSVSRSIGDAHLKDWVSAQPDTNTLTLTPDMEYLVLASDGLWDQVSNQEAMDLIMQACPREKSKQLPVATLNEKGDEIDCVSKSPSSKLTRVSIIKSPCCKKIVNDWMTSEDENSTQLPVDTLNEKRTEFEGVSKSPSSKLRRVSIIKSNRIKSRSPCCKKTVNDWMTSEDESGNENEGPPAKARRISTVNQTNMKMKIYSPNQENSGLNRKQHSNALVAAGRELGNLAVSRGSSDDITVMIIDLSHFKS